MKYMKRLFFSLFLSLLLQPLSGFATSPLLGKEPAPENEAAAKTLPAPSLKGQEVALQAMAEYAIEPDAVFLPEHNLTLWYTQPAEIANPKDAWQDFSLPIGNGQLGCNVYGNVKCDKLTLNEKTLWRKKFVRNYGAYQYFGEMYAEQLDDDTLFSGGPHKVEKYSRYLDLEDAVCVTQYTLPETVSNSRFGGGIMPSKGSYRQEYLASQRDGVIVAHYTSTGSATIDRRFTLVSGKPYGVESPTTYLDGEGTFGGKMDLLSFRCHFKVQQAGGTLTTTPDGIVVRGAREVLVIICCATDYDPKSRDYVSGTSMLSARVADRVGDAAWKGWGNILRDHKRDYKKYFNACRLNLQGKGFCDTKTLIDNYEGKGESSDNMLEQLYFAYGRYLSICSSQGVDLPSNLQGIWACAQDNPWNADIHTNINVQMNYWPVENTNLSDMHMPLLNYIINEANPKLHTGWKDMAREQGQQRGWTVYTESDIFGQGSTFMTNYVIANAWLCTHLWQHYRYTLDKDFLMRAFPAMLSCSQFWMDRLVKGADGSYECPNEWSPEQGPSENAVPHAQQLVRELFDNTIAAVSELDAVKRGLISKKDWDDLLDKRAHLDLGLRTETYTAESKWGEKHLKYGMPVLKEWKYSPFTAGYNLHRHQSHLMCLYPFSQVEENSPLYEAAVNSLRQRGDISTGWSLGWKMNLWARAHDGDHAHLILRNALRHSGYGGGTNYSEGGGVYYNLWDSHSPFQIDGNFGVTAGIAEMLLQSHGGVLQILPALPSQWPAGSIEGLKAEGNFTVSIEWQRSRPTRVIIENVKGAPLRVKSLSDLTKVHVTNQQGKAVKVKRVSGKSDVYDFKSKAGDVITIRY